MVGQALVAFLEVPWLPPMAAWQSGLLPYPVLLVSQAAILGLQAKISWDLWRGRGVFAWRRPAWGRGLMAIAVVYALAMVLRYGLTMAWYPERRWLGTGTIPVVFHWVLAGYLFTLGRFNAQRGASGT